THMLNDKLVWEALLDKMPMTAMIRNLGVMTAKGVLTNNFDENTKKVVKALQNELLIKKAKVHPYQILLALKTYCQGRGTKGSLSWTPVPKIVVALDDAFYLAFKNV